MIIALFGPAGCGKSTAAAYLAERHGFVRVRFAGPLKAMLRAFLSATGMSAKEIERRIEGDLKEVPCQHLGGTSPRHAMQSLGTGWGRDMIAPGLWVDAWRAAALNELRDGAPGVVVEDLRFPNEAGAVQGIFGKIVRIERPSGTVALASHVSEGQALPADIVIRNDGTPAVLHARLDGVLRRFLISTAA